MFHHVVLISFQPQPGHTERERVFQLLRNLGKETAENYGITYWSVEYNTDVRTRGLIGGRSIDVVEVAIFKESAGFRAWQKSPEHRKVAEEMSKVMDWVIGDVDEPENLI